METDFHSGRSVRIPRRRRVAGEDGGPGLLREIRISSTAQAGFPLKITGWNFHCFTAATAACVAPGCGRIAFTASTVPFGRIVNSSTIEPERDVDGYFGITVLVLVDVG
jgi:hypothetical protein